MVSRSTSDSWINLPSWSSPSSSGAARRRAPSRLAEVASDYPASIVQRTGWLLDYMAGHVDVEVDTEPLVPLASERATPTPLDPGHGRSGTLDRRWNVIVTEYTDEESS